ncbi:MAG: 16S rRNA (cytosine(967)-C(5))-methyltransferase RsmB [Syntrophomonas sp.]|nr:16S rRNA (cytosine(967)-C(5))-methyltransferase RsmB [Syntrophomonas sp.]
MTIRSAKGSFRDFSDPRELALEIVFNVLEKGAYSNIALDQYLKKSTLIAENRHMVTEIVNGTIRMKKHLDWVLDLFLRQPLDKQNPWLRNSLRIGLYQMFFMEKIPDYAAVDGAVNLCRQKTGAKLAGVANGVLRNISRSRATIKYPQPPDGVNYLAAYYSQPEWLVERLIKDYGIQDARITLQYFNERPSLVLRNNDLLGNRDDLISSLKQEEIYCQISPNTPWGLQVEAMGKSVEDILAFKAGRFYIQNEGSMLAVAILKPEAGETIADLCCGVGGKATFMAEQMNNRGIIDAYDIYSHKLALLANNCARLGITIIKGHKQDIVEFEGEMKPAQGVLLDAPCSGLGVLNRRADSRWRINPEILSELPVLQGKLLQKAAEMVMAGGRLVYSTCTINNAENEMIAEQFVANNPDFVFEGFKSDLSFFPLDSQDKSYADRGMLTIMPGKYNTDGMFYAKLRRKSSS